MMYHGNLANQGFPLLLEVGLASGRRGVRRRRRHVAVYWAAAAIAAAAAASAAAVVTAVVVSGFRGAVRGAWVWMRARACVCEMSVVGSCKA